MNKVFELSYEQHLNLAYRDEVHYVVAGYTQSKTEADAFLKAHAGHQVQTVELSDDDMWMVS